MIPILVRATINLQGFRAGSYAWVDPDDDWIQTALEKQWLVREAWRETTAPPPAAVDARMG